MDSTTELAYIAASKVAKEADWMRKFISELGVVSSIGDKNGAIASKGTTVSSKVQKRT